MTGARLLLLGLLALAGTARAHDIGIAQARLTELEGGAYRLAVESSPGVAHFFQPPVLPEHCTFTGSPRGAQGGARLTFEFACAGGLTAEHALLLPWNREGTMLVARWRDGSEARGLFQRRGPTIEVALAALRAGSGSLLDAARRYLALGVEHILMGIDHLLFVLALLLIVRDGWMLVKTITAFTVAHSLSLGLAALGFVNVPPGPTEAVIALSILFLAVEVVHKRQGKFGLTERAPWIVAFLFGLFHGLGFAGALTEVGLPEHAIPLALFMFNVGVETGQILFVCGVLAVAAALRRVPVAWPAGSWRLMPYTIGSLAAFWTIQRVFSFL